MYLWALIEFRNLLQIKIQPKEVNCFSIKLNIQYENLTCGQIISKTVEWFIYSLNWNEINKLTRKMKNIEKPFGFLENQSNSLNWI